MGILDDKLTRTVTETKYLSEENSNRYRPIIRFLYNMHHQKYKPSVKPSEIYQHLKQYENFANYEMEMLERDLKVLVEWNNLETFQDSSDVKSVEEYNRNRYQYKLSIQTVEIERTMIKLENTLHSIKGSLEKRLTDTLLHDLIKLYNKSEETYRKNDHHSEIHHLWEEVFSRFAKLTESATDYLSHINSETMEQLMKEKAFVPYKEKLVNYLQDFVTTLQGKKSEIENVIEKITHEKIDDIIHSLIKREKEIPRNIQALPSEEELTQSFLDGWDGLRRWFITVGGNESYLFYLLRQTQETIRKIIKLAQINSESRFQVKSRKEDFLHLARLFHDVKEIGIRQEKEDEAEAFMHENFAFLFGVESVRHMTTEPREDQMVHETIWYYESDEQELKDKSKIKRTKRIRQAIADRTEEKKQLRKEKEEKRMLEENMIRGIIEKGTVILGEMKDVDPVVRQFLLGCIGRTISTKKRTGKTEYGQEFVLRQRSDKEVIMECLDGELELPDFEIQFYGGERNEIAR